MRTLVVYLFHLPKHVINRILQAIAPVILAWKVEGAFRWRPNPKSHGLHAPLIVSLTSYPARFGALTLTLKCLLSQKMAPDQVILWIAHGDKGALTPDILDFQRYGLEIYYCDDLRSYKKIIPALQRYGDAFIVTADDDLYYWPTWLEELVLSYNGNNLEVICHRAHKIRLGDDKLPLPYKDWEIETHQQDVSSLNFPTCGGGALYPPGVFYSDVLRIDVFKRICPSADDVWLYWMLRLNGGIVRKVGLRRPLYNWPDTQQTALFHSNVGGGGNDEQIRAMIQTYGFPGEEP